MYEHSAIYEHVIVLNDDPELWEMVTILNLHPYCEGVEVSIHLIKEYNCMDDHSITPGRIELEFPPGIRIPQPQLQMIHPTPAIPFTIKF